MEEKEKIEKHFQEEGRKLVDMLFNEKLFIDSLSRDNLDGIEHLIAYYIQSRVKSELRCIKMLEGINETKYSTNTIK